MQAALENGAALERAASLAEHGEYQTWIKANFDWSLRTADRLRNLSKFADYLEWLGERDLKHAAIDNLTLSAAYVLSEMVGPIIHNDDEIPRPKRDLEPHENSVLAHVVTMTTSDGKPVGKAAVLALIEECTPLALVVQEPDPDPVPTPWDEEEWTPPPPQPPSSSPCHGTKSRPTKRTKSPKSRRRFGRSGKALTRWRRTLA